MGDDRADQEAAGVHGTDVAELGLDIALDEGVSHMTQAPRGLEQRGDVAKDHAGFGEIRYRADQGFEVEGIAVHEAGILKNECPPVYPYPVSSALQSTTGQRTQLDRVEDVDFLAFGGNQAVLLEAGENP
ncbi:hypothetical protein D3C72_2008630 [compost metagenome]